MHGGLRLSPTAGTYHCSPNGWLPRFTVTVIEFLSGSMVLASDVRLFILIGMVLLLFRPFVYFPFRLREHLPPQRLVGHRLDPHLLGLHKRRRRDQEQASDGSRFRGAPHAHVLRKTR